MKAMFRTGADARQFNLMGIDVRVRAGAAETEGALSALEQVVAPGKGSPLHTTPHDKMILVLDGAVAITLGDEVREAAQGSVAFIPRGTPHCFRNTSADPARILVLMTPGGHEDFLADAATVTPGSAAFAACCARHQVALVTR